ncbi:MAG: choice-of-anchor J domain-containing protein [Candidatus Delongbacteria bacterium]|nr:choice-of-anchor J domain-containing protein [Candidatus Delongbacteria bacterium]MBN2834219.1 choice-of-anchor J domain-containing protein [Candidatus Delongbacteria bacterium]
MKTHGTKTIVAVMLLSIVSLFSTTLYQYSFDDSIEEWTIKNDDTGFMHGFASSLVYTGNGGNETKCIYIQDVNLAGGSSDIGYSPLLDLSTYSGTPVKLSFDYLHSAALDDELKIVYRTSPEGEWLDLTELLPTTAINDDIVFLNYDLMLPDEALIENLQIGFSYIPVWASVGAAFDNVKIESFQDSNPPEVVYISGLVNSGENLNIAITVDDDSELVSTISGVYTINNQTYNFSAEYVEFDGENKYKVEITIDSNFLGEISFETTLSDIHQNQNSIDFIVNVIPAETFIYDGFENYTDFSNNVTNWTFINRNNSGTYYLGSYEYPNQGEIPGFIVFNNQATNPPLPDTDFAFEGVKSMMCMSALNPPNDNWLISPPIVSEFGYLSFWARSIQSIYGLDRFEVYYSLTGSDPSDFIDLNPDTEYLEAPVEWTNYSYEIPPGAKYFAIRSLSDDNFGLLTDMFSYNSSIDITESTKPLSISLFSNYPNPFNNVTTISFELNNPEEIELNIYNPKGELVENLVYGHYNSGLHQVSFNCDNLSSGIYFAVLKTKNSDLSQTRRIVLLK